MPPKDGKQSCETQHSSCQMLELITLDLAEKYTQTTQKDEKLSITHSSD